RSGTPIARRGRRDRACSERTFAKLACSRLGPLNRHKPSREFGAVQPGRWYRRATPRGDREESRGGWLVTTRVNVIAAMAQQRMKLLKPDGPYDRPFIAETVATVTHGLPDISDDDRRAATAEIEAREQVTIGRTTKLKDDTGHVPWYFGRRRS